VIKYDVDKVKGAFVDALSDATLDMDVDLFPPFDESKLFRKTTEE